MTRQVLANIKALKEHQELKQKVKDQLVKRIKNNFK